jgi:hypothetical protein
VARHRDFSSFWGNLAGHDGRKSLRFLVVMHGTAFATQRHIIRKGMDCRMGNVGCGDATGLGMDSNETLATVYREAWEPVTFSGKTKSELGSLGRTAYGDRTQVLPQFDPQSELNPAHLLAPIAPKAIATDLYAIQCQPTGDAADKRLVLSETENPLLPDSHCDIGYSNLLSLKAGGLLGGRNGPRRPVMMEMPIDL